MESGGNQLAEIQERINENLKHIRNRLMVFSGKGGVGKTTVAVNLALALARAGQRVGILDTDIHGPNVPKMVGVEQPVVQTTAAGRIEPVRAPGGVKVISMSFFLPGYDPVVWRGPLKMRAIMQFLADVEWGELDWLIIDSPPGTGDEPLSIAQLVPGALALVVTTPQEVAAMDARRAVEFARLVKLQVVGIVENMSTFTCPHCGKETELFPGGGVSAILKELMVPVLVRIPFVVDVAVAGDSGKAIVLARPDSPVAQLFSALAARLLDLAVNS